MIKYQGKNSNYQLNSDKIKKVFHAQASGFFSEEDGASFLKDYDAITKTFPSKDYALVIDAAELKPSSPAVANMLGTLLQRYNYRLLQQNITVYDSFLKLCKSDELEEIEKFLQNDAALHSYEQFDKYFEEYFAVDKLA